MRDIAVVVNNENEGTTPIKTIEAIKAAGFENVFIQWYNDDWECTQEEQLKYINKLGLKIIFAHLGYKNINAIWEPGETGDTLVANYKKDIDNCKKNNLPMIVMHLTSKTVAPQYNEIGLSRIREITDHAKSNNIKVAFENTKIKGYLEYVMSNINDNNTGICFDAGHWHTHFNGDFNFQLFKNRILAVHLHDNDQSGDTHLLPFDGTINWNLLINKLKENNYSGPITLESCYSKEYHNISLLEFYKKGYEVAKKLADQI